MKIHELKTDPQVFAETWRGDKNYEVRLDDRNYQPGDILVLRETESDGEYMLATGSTPVYTGRQLTRRITCKTTKYGMLPGWCVLGLQAV